jgi:hypothetical protein
MMRYTRRNLPYVRLMTALLVAGLASAALVAGPQRREHHVAVSVLAKDGSPVTTLTAADFVVREDNATREILNVTPDMAPSHVVLLVDDSQITTPLIPYVRDGLNGFVERALQAPAHPALRLVTFGERPTVQVEFTAAPTLLTNAIDRLVARTGSGAYLLDAIMDVTKDLQSRHVPDAAIVAFVAEAGQDFSTATHTPVSDALKAAGASLWTVTLHDTSPDTMSTEARERAIVIGDVTADSGGTNKIALGRQGIAPGLLAVANAITSRYDVTYGRPDRLIPPKQLTVGVRDRSMTVHVRRWPAE